MFAGLTAVGVIAVFFLPWYEDPQSYTETYGIDGLFEILMSCVQWMTAAFGVLSVVLAVKLPQSHSSAVSWAVPVASSGCL